MIFITSLRTLVCSNAFRVLDHASVRLLSSFLSHAATLSIACRIADEEALSYE